ncbi:hypothetical protein MPSI1_001762 [Malassezia psittaci]|uniref:ABM domain-containing protein n=1 Tax=Malassezia psittaci TaxID=1821823 RepID=A0AAF0JE74_9BASI|nr:hypothetical protein MPSI1_001762 [Malassezia psittaci]
MAPPPPSEGPFILVATLVAKGKSEADQLAELVVAVAKRANSAEEPGTKTYRVTREHSEALKLVIFEEYESAEALAQHQAADEFQKLAKAAPDLASVFDFDYLHQLYPN